MPAANAVLSVPYHPHVIARSHSVLQCDEATPSYHYQPVSVTPAEAGAQACLAITPTPGRSALSVVQKESPSLTFAKLLPFGNQ